MTILLVHNHYQQPGGEDHVFEAEGRLLQERGHRVLRFTRHNDEVAKHSRLAVARDTLWSRESYEALRALVQRERPAVVHFHNTLPLVSPAAYYAVRQEGAAVVQTLHNYRLMCPAALFFRDGAPCEDCLGKAVAWPGVLHGCYRGSRTATAVVAGMNALHRGLGTWREQVDVYVALSRFARERFIAGGLAPERVVVKPNFVFADTLPGRGAGGYALFAGRLVPEKGVGTLLDAWERHPGLPPLRILGDGPMAEAVAGRADALPSVTWLGRQPLAEVQRQMADAALLVAPSTCYETFGLTVIEAFAAGTPALVATGGALEELVTPGENGWHVPPNQPDALARQVAAVMAAPEQLPDYRAAARRAYEAQYTPDACYEQLRLVYARALGAFLPSDVDPLLTFA